MTHRSRHLFLCLLCLLVFAPLTTVSAQEAPQFRVYLAFEDGPTDAYTPGILDTLAQYNAKATFVIAGFQIAGREQLLQREIREGHALINHLWEEPGVYAGASDEVIIKSYQRTENAIRKALGDLLPIYAAQTKMFWQPGGAARPFPTAEGINVITYNWNVNSDDCGWGMPDDIDLDTAEFDQAVIQNVLGEPMAAPGFYSPYNVFDYGDGVIIIFHDLNRVTGRVLPTILQELQAAGATFATLPRPGDELGTMPISLGTPPMMGDGVEGYTIPAEVRTFSRLRDIPGVNGSILTTLAPGTSLTAIGRATGWIEVQYEEHTAWIARELVDLRGAIPNLPLRALG